MSTQFRTRKNSRAYPITPHTIHQSQYTTFTPAQLIDKFRWADSRAEQIKLKRIAVSRANKSSGEERLKWKLAVEQMNVESKTDEAIRHKLDDLYQHNSGARDQINTLEMARGLEKKELTDYIVRKYNAIEKSKEVNRPDKYEIAQEEEALKLLMDITKIHPAAIKQAERRKAKQLTYIAAPKERETGAFQSWHPESQKIVEMTPEQYLSLTPKADFTTYNTKNLKTLKRKMRNHEELDMPFLDVNNLNRVTSHEGRTRAQAAKELGIKKIPVILYARGEDGRNWEPASTLTTNIEWLRPQR